MTVADHWHDLVTTALLGTDRREPPEPPPGPLADVVADDLAATPSARLLTSVAAAVAVRRAGLQPRPPVVQLSPPLTDDRLVVSPAAARRWRHLTAAWPVLEDEWLATVDARRLGLPPDVLVGLLRRHRGDRPRRAMVMRLGGAVAEWLVEHQPELAVPGGRASPGDHRVPARPVPPTLLPLLNTSPDDVVAVVVSGVRDGTFAAAHRAVLVNFVARVRPDVCQPLADALRKATHEATDVGLLHVLIDLAETRHNMLLDFT